MPVHTTGSIFLPRRLAPAYWSHGHPRPRAWPISLGDDAFSIVTGQFCGKNRERSNIRETVWGYVRIHIKHWKTIELGVRVIQEAHMYIGLPTCRFIVWSDARDRSFGIQRILAETWCEVVQEYRFTIFSETRTAHISVIYMCLCLTS